MSTQKLDPQLVFLQEQKARALPELAETGMFALLASVEGEETKGPAEASVLIQYDGDPAALAKAGYQVRTVAGDVVTATLPVRALGDLAGMEGVVAVEGARPMLTELDLAVPESRANVVHTGPPGHRGSGVIVGIADTGVDWRHDNFRRGDGTSRIISIWDQSLAPQGGETSPAGFGYGVEYSQAQINAALAGTGNVRHVDDGSGHGTHVTGIAAGDGSAAGQNRPAGTFVGLAPESEIIVVAVGAGAGRGLGDSARALDAVAYVFQRAATLNRPAVVNMSLGDNVGPHDGTSLLERGLDNLLGGQGRAFVKSAGNAGGGGIHAGGTVAPGGTQTVGFVVQANDTSAETLDIWYEGPDRFGVRVTEPGGPATATVTPNNTQTINLANGNRVFVDSRLNDPNNGDNRIFMTISAGTAATIEAGTWTFTLVGTQVTNGRFDAWIQRGNRIASFVAPHESRRLTLSTPGTAQKVITAGNYITRGAGVGNLAASSSRGPTRDGRAAPDVAAPGTTIISARAAAGTADRYVGMGGTSMAAPHITGAIALMLQQNRALTQQQIKECLRSTARADAFTGTTPNDEWGAGKLDVAAAFACVAGPKVITTLLKASCLKTKQPKTCLQTLKAVSCLRVTRLGVRCPKETIRLECVVTLGSEACPPITRTPDCVVSMRAICPPDTRGPCQMLPDPLEPIVQPGRLGGRLIIGRESETGEVTWYGFDPYGELESIAEGGELWSEGEDDDEL
ncbi:MAG TPA: S8 family peptidase [Solirubrobacteraceae bacterium]|nr:S8 family peptidase [Solirubrobacteraceae bacterium]